MWLLHRKRFNESKRERLRWAVRGKCNMVFAKNIENQLEVLIGLVKENIFRVM